jgi:hypothetical protein
MTHTRSLRIAALLAVLAIATAACSGAVANGATGTPTTPTTEAPADDTPVADEPMPSPGNDNGGSIPDIVYRPIDVEGDLPGDGDVHSGGTLISVDGNTVTVGFWMGVEDCYGVERIDIAETETKVAVDITIAARALDQVCIAIAEARSVTVELDAPLGDRILEIGGAPANS